MSPRKPGADPMPAGNDSTLVGFDLPRNWPFNAATSASDESAIDTVAVPEMSPGHAAMRVRRLLDHAFDIGQSRPIATVLD